MRERSAKRAVACAVIAAAVSVASMMPVAGQTPAPAALTDYQSIPLWPSGHVPTHFGQSPCQAPRIRRRPGFRLLARGAWKLRGRKCARL